MRVNTRRKQLELKVVYYGPGFSGKTTNLCWLHEALPDRTRGRLVSLNTETERTLFFDYFPMKLGQAGRYAVKVDLFTVPGQSFYHATRHAVLEGVDGIVFIADSDPRREEANILAREDMEASLKSRGRSLAEVPHLYQWNKRDLERTTPVEVLERLLNPERSPSVSAVATTGEGVFEAHDTILREVLNHVSKQHVVA